ncbi:MAG: hypothetical protein COU68_04265 [Candidatus Pacebacteria bacterium CG10_big_fil_rev_8_21_14_0_10_45_6]|nr:MAG: hypothetical protein COU68_04265 [Candidatus Pacebacteria bacterium CG10_big_fil_rev_8_21_14_0_10_45_6]
MIFNLVATVILIAFPFADITTHESNDVLSIGTIHDKANDSKDTLSIPDLQDPYVLKGFFDLDNDGESEEVTISSTLGKEIGDENTKIYINNSEKSALVLHGYFDGIEVRKINSQGLQILEVRTASGHSIDTTFYTYEKRQLNLMPVSTSKPPSFYGIVSRNKPEFKDIDNDGTLELLAYYRYFPPEKQRTVEVYKFDGLGFIKTQEYEETLDNTYF